MRKFCYPDQEVTLYQQIKKCPTPTPEVSITPTPTPTPEQTPTPTPTPTIVQSTQPTITALPAAGMDSSWIAFWVVVVIALGWIAYQAWRKP